MPYAVCSRRRRGSGRRSRRGSGRRSRRRRRGRSRGRRGSGVAAAGVMESFIGVVHQGLVCVFRMVSTLWNPLVCRILKDSKGW